MEIEVPKFRRVPREIGSETSNVDIIERNRNDGLLLLDIKIDHETTIVPVFDLREDSHKREIAKVLISGDPVAAFGVGNYGIAIGIDHPKRGRFPNSWEHYWKFKPDRPRDAKIPILMPPKYWSEIIDFRKIHSGFKPLFNRGQLERAYREAVIFHIVAPSYNYAPHINHPALVTAEDGKNSVSAFWWDDPDLEEIADIAMRLDPNVLIGISSFNDRGENPAFNYDEVKDYIMRKKKVPFKYIIRDSIGEKVGVKSSHPQFKVPENDEKPVWQVVRRGARSVKRFLQATRLPFEAEGKDSALFAPRAHSEDVDLDNLIDTVHELILRDYSLRKAS
ncbi:hypothetical protein A3J17_00395 [Candidatus Curtissbacteria bacterium RIFCSPLOWO2_02_FULL_40_11]|uniref:Uncharacterized protein n=1 Tax=Candidatus Curtissbacteria bacterium RIFCSPLOWO2_12_FULL_38_9 TaxID=1797735 RepID=A0A1F5IBV8_9BACT|nr:MAG: hypothetical protein A3E11_01105 [Candidatus Curtissbacteria bacterium RIFCSPHIGHO2_12_FULL_38_37]OGE01518.1 MAG: hypothetical protein A3J17_00395 [Candidatus Curtissbacteria bacterium RIFCSPLOWO2_02_FULL_40_11]OGE13852.1 MAG: hypothetical protein A3G14_01740 [Candidatus Curtissbacteria bacterium RIFCSPLOWO2_12_FULL_38_9]